MFAGQKIAPTTAMASSALVSDISGVCSSGETRRITSKPMNPASMNTYRLVIRSSFIVAAPPAATSAGNAKNSRTRGVHHFPALRQQRFADDFVVQVRAGVCRPSPVQQKRAEVPRIHLAGVIGHADWPG